MFNRLLSFIRSLHLDGVQGADEQRSKPYMKYGERVAQSATPQSAKSTGGVPSFAGQQVSVVHGSERGMTSIVVVFVLVTLLTLIGIGFTKIMNRSLQSSAASQQASAANYAAQSGVNDVLSYLKTNPATAAAKCDDLIKTGGPLASAAKISSDGNTAYTCVLVDPNPTSLFYQGLAPYKSQIVKITTSATLSSLLFSWQSTNRQHNQLVAAGAQTFFDEKTWSDKNYAPLLRVTLYPIPASGDLSGVQVASKTFFLYPQNGGSNTLAYAAAGDTTAVNCASKNIGSFSGSADYDCNLVINNLPAAAYFYTRFTPYYDQAVVKIKGNDGSVQAVQFKNVQSVIDVTAKSGGATKRLQARVDTSSAGGGTDFNISAGSDSVPEFALSSAGTICKRLVVPPSGLNPVKTDDGSTANCPFNLYNVPTVSITASPPTIASGGSSTLTWTTTNADRCTASGDWSGNKPTNNSASTGPLSGPKTYTYTLTCDGPGGSGNNSATVTVNAPSPAPTASISYAGPAANETSMGITYACGNSVRAQLTFSPNMHGGITDTVDVPLSDTARSGGGYYWPGDLVTIKLTCTNSAGATATASFTKYFAPPIHADADAYIIHKKPGELACGDSPHFWVVCVSWWRSYQGSISSGTDANNIAGCVMQWNHTGNYGDYTSPLQAANSDSFPIGFSGQGQPQGSLTVSCYSKHPDADGGPKPPGTKTISSFNVDNISSLPPAGGGGGPPGGGGGGLPPPPDPCAIRNIRLYPNYGLMTFFARVIIC